MLMLLSDPSCWYDDAWLIKYKPFPPVRNVPGIISTKDVRMAIP